MSAAKQKQRTNNTQSKHYKIKKQQQQQQKPPPTAVPKSVVFSQLLQEVKTPNPQKIALSQDKNLNFKHFPLGSSSVPNLFILHSEKLIEQKRISTGKTLINVILRLKSI
jgi:hypothetical protein